MYQIIGVYKKKSNLIHLVISQISLAFRNGILVGIIIQKPIMKRSENPHSRRVQ